MQAVKNAQSIPVDDGAAQLNSVNIDKAPYIVPVAAHTADVRKSAPPHLVYA